MGFLQGQRDLPNDAEGDGQIGRPLAGEVFAQVAAIHEFEGHVAEAVAFAGTVNLHDVRMVERGDGLGFGLEALHGGRRCRRDPCGAA